jgi:hypothetical protein
MIKTNHLAKDLVTKGFLDISILTKGFVLPFSYEIVTKKKRKRGGGSGVKVYDDLKRDLQEFQQEDVEYIKVYVDWYKQVKRNKKVYATLVERKVEAVLYEVYKENKIPIKIEIVDIEIEEKK